MRRKNNVIEILQLFNESFLYNCNVHLKSKTLFPQYYGILFFQ